MNLMLGMYSLKLFRLDDATEKELLSEQIIIILSNNMVINGGELGRTRKLGAMAYFSLGSLTRLLALTTRLRTTQKPWGSSSLLFNL